MEQTHALGRRKAAVARVYLTAGKGNVVVNGRALENYFALDSLRYIVNQPFAVTATEGQFDVKVTVVGGGIKGQAEAIRLGIARALCETAKRIVLLSRQPDCLPAMLARLSVRNLASLVHADASSSASDRAIAVLRRSRGLQTLPFVLESCHAAENHRDRKWRYPTVDVKSLEAGAPGRDQKQDYKQNNV